MFHFPQKPCVHSQACLLLPYVPSLMCESVSSVLSPIEYFLVPQEANLGELALLLASTFM